MSISIGGKTVQHISIGGKGVCEIKDGNNNIIFEDYYEQANYIQSSGTQYINTGVDGPFNGTVKLKYSVSGITSSDNTTELYGAFNGGSNVLGWRLSKSGSQNLILLRTPQNSAVSSVSVALDTVYEDTLSVTSSAIAVSGDHSVSVNSGLGSIGFSSYLFANNNLNAGARWFTSGKIYSCTIVENGETVRNLIPCTLTADIPASKDSQNTARTSGTVGMWDTVTDKFYANAGTGTFVAG